MFLRDKPHRGEHVIDFLASAGHGGRMYEPSARTYPFAYTEVWIDAENTGVEGVTTVSS